MEPTENQIIVYQPNGVMKIDVRFDGETVWLLQAQIAELFSCSLENVRLHLKNIYACGELEKTATSKESLEVRKEGNRSVTRKFLIDDKELYLIGASLKDLGRKCFGFTKMDAGEIARIKKAAFAMSVP